MIIKVHDSFGHCCTLVCSGKDHEERNNSALIPWGSHQLSNKDKNSEQMLDSLSICTTMNGAGNRERI